MDNRALKCPNSEKKPFFNQKRGGVKYFKAQLKECLV